MISRTPEKNVGSLNNEYLRSLNVTKNTIKIAANTHGFVVHKEVENPIHLWYVTWLYDRAIDKPGLLPLFCRIQMLQSNQATFYTTFRFNVLENPRRLQHFIERIDIEYPVSARLGPWGYPTYKTKFSGSISQLINVYYDHTK